MAAGGSSAPAAGIRGWTNVRESVAVRPASPPSGRRSVIPWAARLELRLLCRRGFLLVFLLPFGIGHAVDDLARLFLGEIDARGGRRLAIPVRQAVAAKAGEVHQVDVLDICPEPQMLEQAPKRRRL